MLTKCCTGCGREFPATTDHFYRKARPSGISLTAVCKRCFGVLQAERRERNYAHVRDIERASQKRRLDAGFQRDQTWWKRNRESSRSHVRNRRARLRSLSGSHTASDIRAIYISQLGLCRYCGEELSDHYHVDHIVPVALGPEVSSNGPENLCLACPDCNQSKCDRWWYLWAIERDFWMYAWPWTDPDNPLWERSRRYKRFAESLKNSLALFAE